QPLGRSIRFLEAPEVTEIFGGRSGRLRGSWIGAGLRLSRRRRAGRLRRDRLRSVTRSRDVGNRPALRADAAADEDAAQKDDDRHHRGGHEEKHQLFAVQLDLMKAVVFDLMGQRLSILTSMRSKYK